MNLRNGFLHMLFSGDKKKPDKEIQQKLYDLFPNASHVEWLIENDNYEASFIHEALEKTCQFSKLGDWIDTRINIPIDKTPACLLEFASQNEYIVSLIAIETPIEKTYELIVRDYQNQREIIITDRSGKVIERKKI